MAGDLDGFSIAEEVGAITGDDIWTDEGRVFAPELPLSCPSEEISRIDEWRRVAEELEEEEAEAEAPTTP